MPQPNTQTCENCVFWRRLNTEMGECLRYAPKPEVFIADKRPEHPQTPKYNICGDWKKLTP